MKKAVLIAIIVGMFGWAVYDLAFQANDRSNSDASKDEQGESRTVTEQRHETTGDQISENLMDATIGINVGNIAPDFQLQTLKGELVKLSDYRGQRVMVNFWATWCPPCRAEMPDIEKFHKNKDIAILAVNLTQSEPNIEQVKDFVNVFNLTFPVLLDKESEVAITYGIRPIPTSFLIDSKGVIQYKAFGAMNYDLMVQEFEKME